MTTNINRRSLIGGGTLSALGLALVACSSNDSSATASDSATSSETASQSASASYSTEVPSLDELKTEVLSSFTQETYTDSETGKELAYNVFLPEGYSESESYPLVHFIGDASTVSDDPTTPLNQYGALIWASKVTQDTTPAIVVVPAYTETVLDDHDGYTTTDWIGVTERFIPWLQEQYAVDSSRIYGTGQSMGCMIHLLIGGTNPDLFTAFMFVDGQWDTSQLSGLEESTFIYHVAGGDDRAVEGQDATKSMLDEAGVDYATASEDWDATADSATLLADCQALFDQGKARNFSRFVAGTVLEVNPQDMEHMASFEPAYKLTGMRQWLLQQQKA